MRVGPCYKTRATEMTSRRFYNMGGPVMPLRPNPDASYSPYYVEKPFAVRVQSCDKFKKSYSYGHLVSNLGQCDASIFVNFEFKQICLKNSNVNPKLWFRYCVL